MDYLRSLLGIPVRHRLQNQIYYNNQAHFHGVIRVGNKAVIKDIDTRLIQNQYKPLLPIAEGITATRDDKVTISLFCIEPHHCVVRKGSFTIEVRKIVDNKRAEYNFTLSPIPDKNIPDGCLEMEYTISLEAGESKSRILRLSWPINFGTTDFGLFGMNAKSALFKKSRKRPKVAGTISQEEAGAIIGNQDAVDTEESEKNSNWSFINLNVANTIGTNGGKVNMQQDRTLNVTTMNATAWMSIAVIVLLSIAFHIYFSK